MRLVKFNGQDGNPVLINADEVVAVGQACDQKTGHPVPGFSIVFVRGTPPFGVKGTPETVAAIVEGKEPPAAPAFKFPNPRDN